ncbi:hypothetical protein P872_08210 [Rhodonellum psychrophilum GCM71 = DSM 17998]|uniref:Uncharacterized protein n=2 Tax=Rhodonellum TaxID=336827 RepID=U5BW84_9BACT|nr:hypothetical protein P872_08210 [Rhodonellum psychrophilum GCM71 = DSM 17998]
MGIFKLKTSAKYHFDSIYKINPMDLKKIIKFKIGSEDWEMPLGVILLLLGITFVLVFGGAYLGFKFGQR